MSEWATDRIEEFEADNARLRALIKQAEWKAEWSEEGGECPWCEALQRQLRYGNGRPVEKTGKHAADCPAFTPEGEVK